MSGVTTAHDLQVILRRSHEGLAMFRLDFVRHDVVLAPRVVEGEPRDAAVRVSLAFLLVERVEIARARHAEHHARDGRAPLAGDVQHAAASRAGAVRERQAPVGEVGDAHRLELQRSKGLGFAPALEVGPFEIGTVGEIQHAGLSRKKGSVPFPVKVRRGSRG
jgi:hypothetical protein